MKKRIDKVVKKGLLTDMKKREIEICEIIFFCSFVLYVIFIHTFMQMDIHDDAVSKTLTEGYTMIEWVKFRYMNWSSRYIQEAMGYYLIWNPLVWKTINILMMVSLPYLVAYLTDAGGSKRLAVCVLVLLYPLGDMSSAGWICTTITYLWPTFFCVLACAFLKKNLVQKGLRWYEIIICYLSVIIASNHELVALLLFLITSYFLGYRYVKSKKIDLIFLFAWLLNLCNLLLAVFSPGVASRKLLEINNWFPEYTDYSLVDKVYVAITRVFNIFINQRNLIYIVFCAVLLLNVAKIGKKSIYKYLAALPLVMVLLLQYIAVSYNVGDVMVIDYHAFLTYIPLIISVVSFVSFIVSLLVIYQNHAFKKYFSIVVLFGSLGTNLAMGFSPTIYVSGARTSIFLYFGLIYLSADLIKNYYEEVKVGEKDERASGFVWFTVGILLLIINTLKMAGYI